MSEDGKKSGTTAVNYALWKNANLEFGKRHVPIDRKTGKPGKQSLSYVSYKNGENTDRAKLKTCIMPLPWGLNSDEEWRLKELKEAGKPVPDHLPPSDIKFTFCPSFYGMDGKQYTGQKEPGTKKELKKLYELFESLDKYIVDYAVKHRSDWFPENDEMDDATARAIIQRAYFPLVKRQYVKKDGKKTSKVDDTKAPTLKLKVYYNNKYDKSKAETDPTESCYGAECYLRVPRLDEDGKPVLNSKGKPVYDYPPSRVEDQVPPKRGADCMFSIGIPKIFFMEKGWGASLVAQQVIVCKSYSFGSGRSGRADFDDTDTEHAGNVSADFPGTTTDNTSTLATAVGSLAVPSDNGSEASDSEADEEEVEVKPKKKKAKESKKKSKSKKKAASEEDEGASEEAEEAEPKKKKGKKGK